MKRNARTVLCATLLLAVAAVSDGQDEPSVPPAPGAGVVTAPAESPVRVEMQLLTAAIEAAVRSIGMGDVREIPHALHRVHEAKQATAAALETGSYRPPKNGDRIERFRALDEAFHRDLERIVVASRVNDVARTAEAVGNALTACNGCHVEFRPPPVGGS